MTYLEFKNMKHNNLIYLALCILSTVSLFFSCLVNVSYAGVVAGGVGLSADPLSSTIALGGSGQSNITVSVKGNLGLWPVDLSASSISGVSTNFNPAHVIIPTGPEEWHHNHSILTISVGDSATPGVYNLTVHADFGILERDLNITLTIQEGQHGGDDGDRDGSKPVGGIIVSENEPAIRAFYMSLTGIVGVATGITVVRKRRNKLKGLHDH